jgi:4-hydroxy-tetrahydrodipicolinate reductase
MKMTLDLCVSNTNSERFFKLGNVEAEPAYIATIMPCIQAIPSICKAEPGLLPSFDPSINWKQDLRDC